MIELFKSYSVSEIIIMIVMICFAIREFFTFFDWCKNRKKEALSESLEEEQTKHNIRDQITEMNEIFSEKEKRFQAKKEEINDEFKNFREDLNTLKKQISLLLDSDRDEIRAYILEKHHFFCYQQKWISDYDLDCLEKRYSHYLQEKGNSYVSKLIDEIRELPKESPK